MNTHFSTAALRHLEDGEYLLEKGRVANADQLFGLSAECSLKAVMVALGMATYPDGNPQDRGHKLHIDQLWSAFQSFTSGRLGVRYQLPLDINNPFADWAVDQRYWGDSALATVNHQEHGRGCRQCIGSLSSLILDGVVS